MTTLASWHPFSDIVEMHHRFDRFFDEVLGDGKHHLAPVDVVRERGRMVVRADVPGMGADDVKIEVSDSVLTIHGEHEEEEEQIAGGRYVRRERHGASFTRSLTLPQQVDPAKIEALCKDGVLEVRIPLPEGELEAAVTTIMPTAG